jgi:hypothetical protein
MGMQLTSTLPSGVSGNHWKITSIEMDTSVDSALLYVSLYLSKAAKEAGNPPMSCNAYSCPLATLFSRSASTVTNPLAASYTYLMTLPDFTSATAD